MQEIALTHHIRTDLAMMTNPQSDRDWMQDYIDEQNRRYAEEARKQAALVTHEMASDETDHTASGAKVDVIGNDLDNRIDGALLRYASGGAGNDTILGASNSRIVGGTGNDLLIGGTGTTDISGDEGDDTIIATSGINRIETGSGTDIVIVKKDAEEVILFDFDPSRDKLDLTDLGISSFEDFNAKAVITEGNEIFNVTLIAIGGVVLNLQNTLSLDGFKDFLVTDAEQPVVPDADEDADAGADATLIRSYEAGGYIEGTHGNDRFEGSDQNDTFYGGKGDDHYVGGTGYNQVDYDGAAPDYTFTRNADGTVTVTSELYGTDTLTDIAGIWFRGSAEWHPTDDLVATNGSGGLTVMTSDDEGGYVRGTAGDDLFEGGAGADVFYGRGGNDEFIGGAGYNQVDYDGAVADYSFVRNDDGTVTASNTSAGTIDILSDISGVWFNTDARWVSVEDLLDAGHRTLVSASRDGGYIEGTGGDDLFEGRDGNDTFYGGTGDDLYRGGEGYNQVDYDGAAADYAITQNEDGSVTVSSQTYGTDTLFDIDGLWFRSDSTWHAIDDAALTTQMHHVFGSDVGGDPMGMPSADETMMDHQHA
ncbi:calcium-binding protein [Fulvimarina sp. 2208YS6-2-32]|uniref:calcium-binding protein n=1 Tax=Fulvimarina uroteuthidis TaxID=3098149 RepID=UPI002AC966FB|nr:calcium-binding protein [Fulvimarina sp. 2208YS6-2-32]